MLSNSEFARQSLELNLFFMQIAKEHSIFLEASFTTRDQSFIEQSGMLKNTFSQLLVETIRMSDGIISPESANSGELVTVLTSSSPNQITMNTVRMVEELNDRAMRAAKQIVAFKSNVLQNVLLCRMVTTNYPLLIDHILREAKFF